MPPLVVGRTTMASEPTEGLAIAASRRRVESLTTVEPWDDDALQQRIADKTVRADGSCWLWTGSHVRGRGTIWFRNCMVSAPRMAKIISDRAWPAPGLQACHSCDNPACVNIDHIWWGTNTQNSHDAAAKGRLHNQKRTHCANGHPLSGDNIRKYKGCRVCRTCAANRQRKWRLGHSVSTAYRISGDNL